MVLVVQPSGDERATIARVLRDDGHEVVELSDGAQLLARLVSLVALRGQRSDSIAVVTTRDGSVVAVLRMLRTARWRTPVVLLADEPEPASELGAVATLCRPPDPRELRAAVDRALAAAHR